jgi:NADH-quinone oxidoreductase subunit F
VDTRNQNKLKQTRSILFCHGTGCVSGKAVEIREATEKALAAAGITDVKVDFTGCHGFCQQGPIAVVEPDGIFYTHVTVDDVPAIVKNHIRDGKPVERLYFVDPVTKQSIPLYKDIPFYKIQQRIVLRNCGKINPEKIEDYIAVGGYESARKALLHMTPDQIIDEVKKSGLRGRGGGGFSTGQKWEFARKSPGTEKYVICNADEGDPGAFMDRSLAEGDPHAVIEGMIIGAFAMGANKGFIYCRAEKPLAIIRFRKAIETARAAKMLGKNIFGSGFDFDIELREGAGAFVCGEETALIASIEGKRGSPRPRPPFPAVSGLWGKPTNINNVKSYAFVPVIISKGAKWFSETGTEGSKGTAVFALTGKIENAGLIEIPMGTPLSTIIYDIGGGIPNGKRFKAVQSGGPSGGCIPASYLNLKVDYETLKSVGAMMGSGGLVVMDEDSCMVDVAKFFLSFTMDESCGKCISCREGTCKMYDILVKITHGQGTMEDINVLEELATTVNTASICGLGQTSPNPVLTTLRHFREEYESHIIDKKCPSVACSSMFAAPCSHTCPAGLDAYGYVSLIKEGKFEEAYKVIMQKMPFPLSIGRVCPAPCQKKCRRAGIDEAIGIRQLKRFAADYAYVNGYEYKPIMKPARPEKIAIIGAGPAGLSAAWDLAIDGYKCTIFEALPVAGGMLAVGIPEYRLPKQLLNREIETIKKLGIEIRLNSKIDDPLALMRQGYKAVIIALGAHKGATMGIEGENLKGVIDAIDFLRPICLGDRVHIGERIAVIGGGNSAIDAARAAVRKGVQEVHIIYRRDQANMPADPEEVKAAQQEGVFFHFLTNPTRILGKDGKVSGIECIKQELGDFDTSGRRAPHSVKGSEFTMEFDMVIRAIGQHPDVSTFKPGELTISKNHTVVANKRTLSTDVPGMFVAGEAFTGSATAIEAIASGQRAASSVNTWILGKEMPLIPARPYYKPIRYSDVPPTQEETSVKNRVPYTELPIAERKTTQQEATIGYTVKEAVEEARRCLRCDIKVEGEDDED